MYLFRAKPQTRLQRLCLRLKWLSPYGIWKKQLLTSKLDGAVPPKFRMALNRYIFVLPDELCYIKIMKNFQLLEKEDSWSAIYNGKTRISIFRLFPGVLLSYNQIKTTELPTLPFDGVFRSAVALRINFSLDGICEILTAKGAFIYVKGGHLSISRDKAANAFSYPTGFYTGIELYIQEDIMEKAPDCFYPFDISLPRISAVYLNRQFTFSTDSMAAFTPIIRPLQNLLEQKEPDIAQLRLYCLLILRMFSSEALLLNPMPVSLLTLRQVECAKAACSILSGNLSKRITVAEIADRLCVGESSLKKWFRDVYGKSISAYKKELRIQEAKKLLTTTDLSVFEIAGKVGYENQAKFTSMFHKYCGYTPSAFRRQQ